MVITGRANVYLDWRAIAQRSIAPKNLCRCCLTGSEFPAQHEPDSQGLRIADRATANDQYCQAHDPYTGRWNSDDRKPKTERNPNPNSEFRKILQFAVPNHLWLCCGTVFWLRISEFGILSTFVFCLSVLGSDQVRQKHQSSRTKSCVLVIPGILAIGFWALKISPLAIMLSRRT